MTHPSLTHPYEMARRFCFTIWEDYARPLFDEMLINYIILGHEKGKDTEKPHVQGYVSFKKTKRLLAVKNFLGSETAHIENARGTDEDNKKYCSKDGCIYYEYGTTSVKGSHKRKAIEEFKDDPDEMRMQDPKKAIRVQAHIINEETKVMAKDTPFPIDQKPWMNLLMDKLDEGPDYRTIIWVYGPQGNEGKSLFAKYLNATQDWFINEGGRKEDILYSYMKNPKRHVVFDIPRDMQDYVNYAVMENLKNRCFTSTKYEVISVNDMFHPIHVVVMANFKPNKCKVSRDRLYVISTENYFVEWNDL